MTERVAAAVNTFLGTLLHNVPVCRWRLSMPDEINQLRRRFLGSAAMTHMLK